MKDGKKREEDMGVIWEFKYRKLPKIKIKTY